MNPCPRTRIGVAVLTAATAVGLAAAGETARVPPVQPGAAPDPVELAAIERIRARLEDHAAKTRRASADAYTVTIPNTTVTYPMMPIPAGEFRMGSAEPEAPADERPPHTVRLDAFWMQAHEVTWDAYLMFMFADQAGELGTPDTLVDALSRPTAPHLEMSFGRGNAGFPAISMTQHAANKFAQWLSARTGEFYRLPTEAEWEYACKAGTETGIDAGSLDDHAWYAANSATPAFSDGKIYLRSTTEGVCYETAAK